MTSRFGAAAIFDLDHTLIAGASGSILARHLQEAGLRSGRGIPGVGAAVAALEAAAPVSIRPSAWRAAQAAKGWAVQDVWRAAHAAAEELAGLVLPYARVLADEHRVEGRQLVLATTIPACLLHPFADKVGFDTLIATQWQVDDGHLTGRVEGPVVWGRAKVHAIASWANEVGVTLKASYAYGASYSDAPLLNAVGHPVVVNPDPRLVGVAALKRWPIRYLDVPDGVIKFGGREPQEWLHAFQRAALIPNARFEIDGTDHIPKQGPAIIVFNHRSYYDAIAAWLALARAGRPVRFLGKKEMFDVPVFGTFNRLWGVIRVDRASGSDEPLNHAIQALRAGELVALAPQGTIPRGPAFFKPKLIGRWGAARLAHITRAPVIPVGLWGTEQVWPRHARLPSLRITGRPTVTVRVGPPVRLAYHSLDRDTSRIMAAIVDLLPDEARVDRHPTFDELARTYPAGYRGDPAAETTRRPGTDT